jgi:hypothetical protein
VAVWVLRGLWVIRRCLGLLLVWLLLLLLLLLLLRHV